jgi:hypothetical protein
MKRKIVNQPPAEADISEADSYFERKQGRLGELFLSPINEVYAGIIDLPESFATISKSRIREARIRQFFSQ